MAIHLKQSEKVLFELLRAGLWSKQPVIPEDFSNWHEVVFLAKHQSILGIIAKTILSDKDILALLPRELRLKLKSFIVSNVMASDHLDEVMVKLVTTMREKGIDPILLKGRSLAVNYPFPELRQCGDIDIYVFSEQLYMAYDALIPFADRLDDRLYVECGRHFSAVHDEVEIEVHRHLSHANGKYARAFEKFASAGLRKGLGHVTILGENITIPEPTFNAYYIFDHLFEHFISSGVGLRQMCDWMLFLHKNRDIIDHKLLHHILESMDMLKAWKIFGTVLVDHMGLAPTEFPFYETGLNGDSILKYILLDGNFGKDSAYYKIRSKYILVKKMKSFLWHITRGTKMFPLFPRQVLRRFIYLIPNALQYIKTHFRLQQASK